MALLPPLKLSEQDKLETLQRLDRFRQWRSLDEKRYCLVCSTIITGREIHIMGGTRGTGPLRVICPSHGCHSIPMDWVRPTDEVLANMSTLQSKAKRRQVTRQISFAKNVSPPVFANSPANLIRSV